MPQIVHVGLSGCCCTLPAATTTTTTRTDREMRDHPNLGAVVILVVTTDSHDESRSGRHSHTYG